MIKILLIALFILGILFSNASQIPAWLLGSGKPSTRETPHWKTYGIIAAIIWIMLFVLVNIAL